MRKIIPKNIGKTKISINIENQNLTAPMAMKGTLIPIDKLFYKNQEYLLVPKSIDQQSKTQ